MTRSIQESTFAIVANGQPDSPPAGPLQEFLVGHGACRVTTIIHPLTLEDGAQHEITVFENGRQTGGRRVRLPSRPPYTFPLDFFVPLWPDPVDCWFAFNNLACLRGLLARRLGRATTVAYWAVDFVPDRFGAGPMTRAYDMLDRSCCLRANARFDLSQAALEGRAKHHGLSPGDGAPSAVVPNGAWLGRLPVVPEDGWRARRVVYLGHLVPRQGVGTLIDALRVLNERGVEIDAEIGGKGPLENDLREQASRLGLDGKVRFRGYIPDHKDVEAFLAAGSVAVAPYDTQVDSFTRFADPGKLKSYAAAGLPIVTTNVPPNARELSERGGAEIVSFDGEALADGIERALASPVDWSRRRAAALEYAREFDWERIFTRALGVVDFRP